MIAPLPPPPPPPAADTVRAALSCLVCSTCDHPLCQSSDILTDRIPQAKLLTSHVFAYELEDLLDINQGVWCYNCSEDVTSSVTLDGGDALQPLPWLEHGRSSTSSSEGEDDDEVDDVAVQANGMTSGSRHRGSGEHSRQRRRTGRRLEVHNEGQAGIALEHAAAATAAAAPWSSSSSAAATQVTTSSSHRFDLIRVVTSSIVGISVTASTERAMNSATITTTNNEEDGAVVVGDGASAPSSAAMRNTNIFADVTVHESGAMYYQHRSSGESGKSWFLDAIPSSRLKCRHCNTLVGWQFTPAGAGAPEGSSDSPTTDRNNDNDDDDADMRRRRAENEIHRRHPAPGGDNNEINNEFRGLNTLDTNAAIAHTTTSHHQEDDTNNGTRHDGHNNNFCVLLLKKLKQRDWNLRDILSRSAAEPSSSTGGVERLTDDNNNNGNATQPQFTLEEELMLRIQSLRAQAALYMDLLMKHKEQGDVQRQLLQSQKDRIGAHEEKLTTLQQIVQAQRQQLDMQHRQMQFQEELLRNQREQIQTQQQQIEVEQLLMGEQNRTIQTQLEQMRVMQAHMRAKDERIRLECEIRRRQEVRIQELQQQQQQLQGSSGSGPPAGANQLPAPQEGPDPSSVCLLEEEV